MKLLYFYTVSILALFVMLSFFLSLMKQILPRMSSFSTKRFITVITTMILTMKNKTRCQCCGFCPGIYENSVASRLASSKNY